MEPESFEEQAVNEEAVEAKNFFARLGCVYSSPREAFTEIGRAPRLILPIIAILLLGAFSGWYVSQKVDMSEVMRAQMERLVKRGMMTEGQMTMALAERNTPSTGRAAAMIAGGGIAYLVYCLIFAGYGKFFSMMKGAKNSYKNLFTVSLYALLAVSIVSTVLTVIILQLKGQGRIVVADPNNIVASNLGTWIESAVGTDVLPVFIMKLLRAVDIFNIWIIALMSIGFSAVSNKLKTASAALWLVGAYVIIHIIGAAIAPR